MKQSGQRWQLTRNNDHQLNSLVEYVKMEWLRGNNLTLSVMADERTPSQNNMIYGLYSDISKSTKELMVDVKRLCKLHYGVSILKAADPEWCDWYDKAVRPLPYETKLMLVDHIPITSEFTKEQATEYIDTILREYAAQGVPIRDPRR